MQTTFLIRKVFLILALKNFLKGRFAGITCYLYTVCSMLIRIINTYLGRYINTVKRNLIQYCENTKNRHGTGFDFFLHYWLLIMILTPPVLIILRVNYSKKTFVNNVNGFISKFLWMFVEALPNKVL